MLPGTDPVAALTREIATGLRAVGREVAVAEVRDRLDRDGLTAVVDELLLAAPGPRRTRLLLVIDQFEELLTQSPPPERLRCAQLLRPAVSGPLQVVVTLRPEFLDQLLLNPELAELGMSRRPFAVQPLVRDALPEVIEQPTRLAGIALDEGLVARLVADTPRVVRRCRCWPTPWRSWPRALGGAGDCWCRGMSSSAGCTGR
jgi:hypothetical protein